MGAGASVESKDALAGLNPQEVAELISSMGPAMEQYKKAIVDNMVSGDLIASMSAVELEETLVDVGVKRLHMRVILNGFGHMSATAQGEKSIREKSTRHRVPFEHLGGID